ncbi:MAG: Fic family protein [Bacteroidales bacterium]|nr:Fic family protein [Bacteroidales bacterium]
MNNTYEIPFLPLNYDFESKNILRQVNLANRKLAELKGIARTIPNENILISTLTLQEAKDSSAVENIVTTHDELYKADLNFHSAIINASTKEVLNYREALNIGFKIVKERKILTNNIIKQIQQKLEGNKAGFRKVPGTALKRTDGSIVYTPPQDGVMIEKLMANLETFINDQSICDIDPLIKVAIIHHQFESIHPFYDGNGRTGRIINVLYLVATDLLELPILYLSRYITHNKSEYYKLIQDIRCNNGNNFKEWEKWILFILKGIEETAEETIKLVQGISELMARYKNVLRPLFGKQYKHELLNNLFFHPYTKIEFIERDLQTSRQTASKYLDSIVNEGLLTKVKVKNTNYYMNNALIDLFINRADLVKNDNIEVIESK